MSILMVFNGNTLIPNHKFYPVTISIRETYKQHLSANVVDYYSFKPTHPVVSDAREVDLVKELTKKKNYCLIMCDVTDQDMDLWLYSSNLENVFHAQLTLNEAFLLDPVGKLIASHSSGTICKEMSEYEFTPEAPEKDLTEEEVLVLESARDEKNYPKALSMVNSVFPGQTLKSKQAIKRFCAGHINRFNKAREPIA